MQRIRGRENSWSRLRGNKVLGRDNSSWRRQLLCNMGSRGATNCSRRVGTQGWNVLVETIKQLLRQVAHLREGAEVRDSGPLIAGNGMGDTLDGSVQFHERVSCAGQTTGRESSA